MILAIDTSLGSAVAVVDPATDVVLAEASSESARGHAEVIGSLIENALEQAAVTPADITAVAAGMGPGPFTGLRIGIAAARGFAVGRGIPVVPVASHDAAAGDLLEHDPEAAFVISTDARRRENTVSAYSGLADGIPVRVAGPELLPQTEDPLAHIAGRLGAAEHVHATRISAGALGRIAHRLLSRDDVPALAPLYLRAPDAKVPGAVKRVST